MLLVGIIGEGESPNATQAQDALETFTDMLDSWSTERLTIWSITNELFNLVPGQQTYSMGPGAQFNTSRPTKVDTVSVRINPGTGPSQIDIRTKILNTEQWASISVKATSSTWPTKVWVDYQNPNVQLNVWPIPQTANPLLIFSFKPIQDALVLTSPFVFPPGYSQACRYNLAALLGDEYNKPISETVARIAIDSKARIKRANFKTTLMTVDDAILEPDRSFNYLTGE